MYNAEISIVHIILIVRGVNNMKKTILLLVTFLILMNIIQSIIIVNKNDEIKSLRYSEQKVKDIFQVTSELAQDLYKDEINDENSTYYYHAIAKASWLLTYMEYNIKYKDANDPLFHFNLALHNLFGFMINEQGRKLITAHNFQIRTILHEIVLAHRELRINDRNKSIIELKEYISQNLSISIEDMNDNEYMEKVPSVK